MRGTLSVTHGFQRKRDGLGRYAVDISSIEILAAQTESIKLVKAKLVCILNPVRDDRDFFD